MKMKLTMKRFVLSLLVFVCLSAAPAQTNPDFKRTEDVIYGRKFGMALTLDVFQPAHPNGVGILLMISGGWFSSHDGINPHFFRALLERGYTVFAVVHGSQPKFTVREVEVDIHRAVRFVRHHAAEYGVDPNRLGITGGSAGGHLSLIMATQGAKGDPQAKDPVDRDSSEVQCVACFFPPTDFLNYSKPGEVAFTVPALQPFKIAFGINPDTEEERQKVGREISPIYSVHSNQPPILILHGDADTLVPIYQSRTFVKRCQEVGAEARLIEEPGKGHGWPGMDKDVTVLADWFDQHLREIKPQPKSGPSA
jgi:acetyl esterase/lipase